MVLPVPKTAADRKKQPALGPLPLDGDLASKLLAGRIEESTGLDGDIDRGKDKQRKGRRHQCD